MSKSTKANKKAKSSKPVIYTLLVRKVMRKFGKSCIYTNKHVNSRTIKCYTSLVPNNDIKMMKKITKKLTKLNIKFEIRERQNDGMFDSIIVEVPMQQL
jgi:hypothetical protein